MTEDGRLANGREPARTNKNRVTRPQRDLAAHLARHTGRRGQTRSIANPGPALGWWGGAVDSRYFFCNFVL